MLNLFRLELRCVTKLNLLPFVSSQILPLFPFAKNLSGSQGGSLESYRGEVGIQAPIIAFSREPAALYAIDFSIGYHCMSDSPR